VKVSSIAAANLRRLFRQRSTIFFTLALPMVIILVIGLATAQFDDRTVPVGVVVAGNGSMGAELAQRIDASGALEVEIFDDLAGLRRAVRRGTVVAGVVVPGGYDATVRSGGRAEITFLSDPTRGFPAPVRAVVAAAVADQGKLVQAARFATANAKGDLDANLRLAGEVALEAGTVAVRSEAVGSRGERIWFGTGFGYQAPANLVLFVFITSIASSAQLIETRRLGVSRRMLGTPTSVRTILAGEALGRFAVAAVQASIIFLAGRFLFGVHWGDPLGAVALIAVFVAVGTSVGMLFGTVFRTPEQAGAIGPPVGIGLGMLGGCMWPLEIVPEQMSIVGHAFPHAWAMDAWIELTAFGAGVGEILPNLAVLAGFVAVLFPLAAWRLRRTLAS
jgi:ABC-2 type transport system permease protein